MNTSSFHQKAEGELGAVNPPATAAFKRCLHWKYSSSEVSPELTSPSKPQDHPVPVLLQSSAGFFLQRGCWYHTRM